MGNIHTIHKEEDQQTAITIIIQEDGVDQGETLTVSLSQSSR